MLSGRASKDLTTDVLRAPLCRPSAHASSTAECVSASHTRPAPDGTSAAATVAALTVALRFRALCFRNATVPIILYLRRSFPPSSCIMSSSSRSLSTVVDSAILRRRTLLAAVSI